MKKNLIISVCCLLLIIGFLYINPYNLYHHFKAEEKVSSIFEGAEIRESLFENDSEVTNVKYLGSDMYHIETAVDTFIIEIKTNKSRTSFQIFQYKQSGDKFGY